MFLQVSPHLDRRALFGGVGISGMNHDVLMDGRLAALTRCHLAGQLILREPFLEIHRLRLPRELQLLQMPC